MNEQEASLSAALDAAKERVFGGDESDEAHKALKDAEWALTSHRIETRSGAASAVPDEGVAAPEPVQVTTEGG